MPHLLFGFLRPPLEQMHAGVHPVNSKGSGIEVDAAVVGGFRQIEESGVMVKVSEQIPCGLGVGGKDDSLPQGLESFEIAALLGESPTQCYERVRRVWFQRDSAACSLFSGRQVSRRVLRYVGSLHEVER